LRVKLTIDFMEEDDYDRIMELTKGPGADTCIDAVGTEAEPAASLDPIKQAVSFVVFVGCTCHAGLEEDLDATVLFAASHLVASQTERRGKFEQVVVRDSKLAGRYAAGPLDAFAVQRPEL
jgi:threonine dehydrogenase-like Zn-dependent dehydrogenase